MSQRIGVEGLNPPALVGVWGKVVSMTERPVNLNRYGISKWEYHELKAFCRQYRDKLHKVKNMIGISSQMNISTDADLIRGKGGVHRPVETIVVRRERLLSDIDMIDAAASFPDDGAWTRALILSCCDGKKWDDIPPDILPTSHRNAFFKARRIFFYRLAQLKNGTEKDIDS